MLYRGQAMKILNIKIDDIYQFLNEGKIKNTLFINSDKDKVISLLGEAPNYLPQKKNNIEIMGYGALNIYLYNNKVFCFSINYVHNYLNNIFFEKIDKVTILNYINLNKITINKVSMFDDIEYFEIDNKKIKIGFLNDILIFISIGM